MQLYSATDGLDHTAINIAADDHHAAPASVSILNKTQSLPPGTTFDLDVALPRDDFQIARVQLNGIKTMPATSGNWRECATLVVTRSVSESMGHSVREASSFVKVYAATYSKQAGDSWLSHKVFDDNVSNRYIYVQDAVLVGSVLRITFKNVFGGSATLWVEGQALLW